MTFAETWGDGRRRERWAPAAVVVLALAASVTSLGNGFAFDDSFIVSGNAHVQDGSNALRLFAQTYWPPEGGGALYRPLTMLGFLAQWLVGGGSPLPFHVVNVLAYVAVSLAVLALARRLLPSPAAWIAAALFAVHPVHVEVVGNVVGQSELWVALAAALASVAYLRMRRRQLAGLPAGRELAAVLALYAAACLSKEHGIVLPGLLAAAEVTVLAASAGAASWRARLRQVAPLYLGLAAVAVVFLIVRSRVVGGLLGEMPHISFDGRPLSARLWTMVGVSTEWIRLLVWPAHLAALYSPPGTPEHESFAPALLVPLLLLAALVALAAWARRARPVLAFGLAWTAVALLPTSNVLFPSGVLLAERSLFLPSVGAMLALGDAAVWAIARARASGPLAVRLAGAAVVALLLMGAARSAARQRVWRDDVTLFRTAVEDEPLSYRAQYIYGHLLLQKGEWAEAERRIRFAMRLMPRDSDLRVRLAIAYRDAGMCGPALAMFEEAMRISPRRPDARVGSVGCLLSEKRFVEARDQARRGVSIGIWASQFRRLEATADSALAARPGDAQ